MDSESPLTLILYETYHHLVVLSYRFEV